MLSILPIVRVESTPAGQVTRNLPPKKKTPGLSMKPVEKKCFEYKKKVEVLHLLKGFL